MCSTTIKMPNGKTVTVLEAYRNGDYQAISLCKGCDGYGCPLVDEEN